MRTARMLPAAAALGLALLGTQVARADPFTVPLQNLVVDLGGVKVTVPITIEGDVVKKSETYVATGTAIGNLADVQANFLEIAQTLELPHDQCLNDNGLNIIGSIDNASVVGKGNAAQVAVYGQATGVACVLDVGAPVAMTHVAISAPVVVDVSPTKVRLKLAEPPKVAAVGFADELMILVSGQINDLVAQVLDKAVIGIEGPLGIAGLPDLEIDIAAAQFFTEGTTLMFKVDGTAQMGAESYAKVRADLRADAPADI